MLAHLVCMCELAVRHCAGCSNTACGPINPATVLTLLPAKGDGCTRCEQDELVSRISRKSIDLLKEHFRDDMTKDDWRLVVKLKAMFDIA